MRRPLARSLLLLDLLLDVLLESSRDGRIPTGVARRARHSSCTEKAQARLPRASIEVMTSVLAWWSAPDIRRCMSARTD